jgi:hypothetical protein
MTLAEYLDAGRFPLTTLQGLTPCQQFRLDAATHADLAVHAEAGKPMDAEQRALWAELTVKIAAAADAAEELRRKDEESQAGGPGGDAGRPSGE